MTVNPNTGWSLPTSAAPFGDISNMMGVTANDNLFSSSLTPATGKRSSTALGVLDLPPVQYLRSANGRIPVTPVQANLLNSINKRIAALEEVVEAMRQRSIAQDTAIAAGDAKINQLTDIIAELKSVPTEAKDVEAPKAKAPVAVIVSI
jgi:cell pole-organizing protein PopZ